MRKLTILVLLFTFFDSKAMRNAGKFFHIVKQSENIVLERFGKFSRVLEPGIQFKIPFIEQARSAKWSGINEEKGRHTHYFYNIYRIDLREHVYDLPQQSVITKDNVSMAISAIVYYKIEDAKKAVYGIDDLPRGIEKLAQTSLRNIIGSFYLDETLVSRDAINTRLCSTLDGATDKWGVAITRVELQEVSPPREIQHAMDQQMTAERTKRAKITQAEGHKSANILQAEGDRTSNILRAESDKQSKVLHAEGERTSRILSAEGESTAIRMIGEAQKGAIDAIRSASGDSDPLHFILTKDYIQTLPKLVEGQNNKLIILPSEMASLSSMLASVISGSKAILETESSRIQS